MRRAQIAESGHSDDDRLTSGDDTERLMASSSDDEAEVSRRLGGGRLHWGWLVVASGFYCVAMVGGVSDTL